MLLLLCNSYCVIVTAIWLLTWVLSDYYCDIVIALLLLRHSFSHYCCYDIVIVKQFLQHSYVFLSILQCSYSAISLQHSFCVIAAATW